MSDSDSDDLLCGSIFSNRSIKMANIRAPSSQNSAPRLQPRSNLVSDSDSEDEDDDFGDVLKSLGVGKQSEKKTDCGANSNKESMISILKQEAKDSIQGNILNKKQKVDLEDFKPDEDFLKMEIKVENQGGGGGGGGGGGPRGDLFAQFDAVAAVAALGAGAGEEEEEEGEPPPAAAEMGTLRVLQFSQVTLWPRLQSLDEVYAKLFTAISAAGDDEKDLQDILHTLIIPRWLEKKQLPVPDELVVFLVEILLFHPNMLLSLGAFRNLEAFMNAGSESNKLKSSQVWQPCLIQRVFDVLGVSAAKHVEMTQAPDCAANETESGHSVLPEQFALLMEVMGSCLKLQGKEQEKRMDVEAKQAIDWITWLSLAQVDISMQEGGIFQARTCLSLAIETLLGQPEWDQIVDALSQQIFEELGRFTALNTTQEDGGKCGQINKQAAAAVLLLRRLPVGGRGRALARALGRRAAAALARAAQEGGWGAPPPPAAAAAAVAAAAAAAAAAASAGGRLGAGRELLEMNPANLSYRAVTLILTCIDSSSFHHEDDIIQAELEKSLYNMIALVDILIVAMYDMIDTNDKKDFQQRITNLNNKLPTTLNPIIQMAKELLGLIKAKLEPALRVIEEEEEAQFSQSQSQLTPPPL